MALLAAFGIAVATTPAAISGAVLLLPFQVSVLGTPSPAVTPAPAVTGLACVVGCVGGSYGIGGGWNRLSWALTSSFGKKVAVIWAGSRPSPLR